MVENYIHLFVYVVYMIRESLSILDDWKIVQFFEPIDSLF